MTNGAKQHDRDQLDAWQACPAGELTQMVQRVDTAQRRVRRQQVYKTAMLSTAVFACVVLTIGSLTNWSGSSHGNITCAQCRQGFTDYYSHVAGKVVLDDGDFVASMKKHLEYCEFCQAKFHQLYPDLPEANQAATRPAVVVAMLPRFSIDRPFLLP